MSNFGIIAKLGLATAFGAMASTALAASCPAGFPSKQITILAGFGAGGGTDAIGRAIAALMERQQGWTVIVENRPGASGSVMAVALKDSPPDGHTIGMAGTDVVTLNPYEAGDGKFTYEDFDYLGSAIQIYFGMVALKDRPYSTLEEFVEYAKEKGHATVSVAGVSQEIAVKKIAKHFNVNITPIPGKGAADALNTAMGGHVDATTQGSQHVGQIKAGKMNQLASMIDRRVDYAPESKTLRESGLDISIESYTGFMVPKGMDPAIKTCLDQALDEAIKTDEYAQLMTKLENNALNLGPDGMLEMIKRVSAFYKAEFEAAK
jgi:tripartite-type tricarboxylate transporter receptor subunit TctC